MKTKLKTKLYLVTRADLDPGQQAVQAAHALREFAALHPEEDIQWYRESNTLAFLAVPNEASLELLLGRAQGRAPVAPFREPDRQDELTALAIGPQGKSLCRGLPTALRDVVRA